MIKNIRILPIILILLLVITSISNSVFAVSNLDEQGKVSADVDDNKVIISGKLNDISDDVTIIVYRTSDNARAYLDQRKTNEIGEFKFEFTLINGTYTSIVSSSSGQYTNGDIIVAKTSGSSNNSSKTAVPEVVIEEPIKVPTDISGHWAEENIKELIKLGAISGYTDDTFKPNANITRGEFATILVKAFDLNAKSEIVFADTANHWAKDYISIASSNGIILGYGDNLFGPNDLITREQMAVMISKVLKLELEDLELSFADNEQISDWAKVYVGSAVKAKVISGYPDDTYKPKANATRAETVTVILNGLKILSN